MFSERLDELISIIEDTEVLGSVNTQPTFENGLKIPEMLCCCCCMCYTHQTCVTALTFVNFGCSAFETHENRNLKLV